MTCLEALGGRLLRALRRLLPLAHPQRLQSTDQPKGPPKVCGRCLSTFLLLLLAWPLFLLVVVVVLLRCRILRRAQRCAPCLAADDDAVGPPVK